MTTPRLILVGDAAEARVHSFARAWTAGGGGVPTVVSYEEVRNGAVDWDALLTEDCILRLESPGRSVEAARTILLAGAALAAEECSPHISEACVNTMTFAKGRIGFPRQWYLGFCALMLKVELAAASCPLAHWASAPHEIAIMFDKPRCHALLQRGGVPVPPALSDIFSYDDLRQRMRDARMPRVFVKLSHGSAASGVVAFETGADREQAWTTVELVREDGGVQLYNSRRLHRYTDAHDIRTIIDELCRHGVHVERWLPKCAIRDRTCDLRRLVIAQQPAHGVVRMSKGPMTNLHLLNDRAEMSLLRDRMGGAWDALEQTCRRVAACFPRSLQVAADIAIEPGLRRHAVLEVNAFGDVLHGVTHKGLSPHEAQVAALLRAGECLPC